MMTRKNLSRRTFAIGMLTAGLCEAATPIIDLKARKSPLINVGATPNFLKNSSRTNFGDLDSLYFDPEPELNATTDKFQLSTTADELTGTAVDVLQNTSYITGNNFYWYMIGHPFNTGDRVKYTSSSPVSPFKSIN